MSDVTNHPYLTRRKSGRWYYKRDVPPDLRPFAGRDAGKGALAQIWRSLETADKKTALAIYAAKHAEIEAQFTRWRREARGEPVPAVADAETTPLTASLARRVLDRWRGIIVEADFKRRGELWKAAVRSPQRLYDGELIPYTIPPDWPCDPADALMGEAPLEAVFLCMLGVEMHLRLEALRSSYRRGDVDAYRERLTPLLRESGVTLSDDDATALARRAMQTEIEVLEKIAADTPIDIPVAAGAAAAPANAAVPLFSEARRQYFREGVKAYDWTRKDELRWRAILDEFVEVVGERKITEYTAEDGAKFRAVQLALPAVRAGKAFKGRSLVDCVAVADKMQAKGQDVARISAATAKDKIGCVSRFFEWAGSLTAGVVNPVDKIKIAAAKKRDRKNRRKPWSVEALNKMFAAPIYTGAESASRWSKPGPHVLKDSAMYWAPLIALFSGMRLGEIIQLHKADVKERDGVWYFDVTNESDDAAPENEKSLKTHTSKREVPVHHMLIETGWLDFVARCKGVRLFPEYEKARDDDSWAKAFSKHFLRFRRSVGVPAGNDFHALRHTVEDALRNAGVSKEHRDAIQGHGEEGVAAHYGDGYRAAVLNDAVQKIAYPGLKLDHLMTPHMIPA